MGGGNLTAVFCDTGWEHPDTYKHVNDVCLQMGVRLITLKSKYDFVSLAVHKKRFPSTNARFCTSELKMKPIIALLFNRCDSNKFQDIIFTKATGMMFLRNRIKFFRPDGTRGDSPGCGSVLIAFGRENAEILRNCSLQGKYVELNNDK